MLKKNHYTLCNVLRDYEIVAMLNKIGNIIIEIHLIYSNITMMNLYLEYIERSGDRTLMMRTRRSSY